MKNMITRSRSVKKTLSEKADEETFQQALQKVTCQKTNAKNQAWSLFMTVMPNGQFTTFSGHQVCLIDPRLVPKPWSSSFSIKYHGDMGVIDRGYDDIEFVYPKSYFQDVSGEIRFMYPVPITVKFTTFFCCVGYNEKTDMRFFYTCGKDWPQEWDPQAWQSEAKVRLPQYVGIEPTIFDDTGAKKDALHRTSAIGNKQELSSKDLSLDTYFPSTPEYEFIHLNEGEEAKKESSVQVTREPVGEGVEQVIHKSECGMFGFLSDTTKKFNPFTGKVEAASFGDPASKKQAYEDPTDSGRQKARYTHFSRSPGPEVAKPDTGKVKNYTYQDVYKAIKEGKDPQKVFEPVVFDKVSY